MKTTLLFFFLFQTMAAPGARAAADDSLTLAQKGCRAFVERLAGMSEVTYGTALVPKDWAHPKGEKIPLFWWKRAGRDQAAPPLVFLHGGVAGNSWALLDKWQAVLRDYPGDFISFDHRGEGCSKTLPSNLDPSAYRHLNARSVVNDMELLRSGIFGGRKWRVVGHSRGAALIHYYLEMFPGALESAHAMGFSVASPELQALNTLTRAQGYYASAQAYLELYPEDEARVQKIRSLIQPDTCWLALDDRRVCGPAVLDVFANYLSRKGSWADLHAKIGSMVDFDSAYAAIQARLPNDAYGHFNYIVGTNGRDFGSPDSALTEVLKSNPAYAHAFLSEARFVGEAVAPAAGIEWRASVDPLDYGKIRRFLSSHPGFNYRLYSGALDPIAPPQAFRWEADYLGPLVTLVNLPDSAHDGWFDPILIANILRP